jgi:predicted esterase
LKAHPGQVAFLTIDIGADDVQTCQTATGLNAACAAAGQAQISTDLPEDLSALKTAYPGLPIFGMDYYDPFLAYWLSGSSGQAIASQTMVETDQLNTLLGQIYRSAGVSMADPASLFQTDDTDPVGTYDGMTVPEDVAVVCQWTGMCTSNDIHANDQGHIELAQAFDQVIDQVTIDTTGVPAGSVKIAYSATLTANGGNAPYKWHIVSGSLPPGLRLRPATGSITGKPTSVGVSTFTVQVTDTKDKVKPTTQESGTATLSLQVLPKGTTMPASGLYSSPQYSQSQIIEHTVQFSSAPDANGVVQPLLMDIFVPPDAATAPRPTIIEVHGGSFVGGSRTDNDADTQQWALDGYVGVTIDYRLAAQSQGGSSNEVALAAAETLDAQQSVRFLKANAATYGVDPTRIAMEGFSAGGALALATGVAADVPYTGPLSSYSPSIAAAVSTGAFLTPGLSTITLDSSEAPALMFQYAYDTATHVSSSYAFETCDALRAAGNACYEVELDGTGHTTWLIPGGPWWSNELGPFIWNELHLATAPN